MRLHQAALASGCPEEMRRVARELQRRGDDASSLSHQADCAEGDHCWHLRAFNDKETEAMGTCCHCDLRLRIDKQIKKPELHGEHMPKRDRYRGRQMKQVFRFVTFKVDPEPYEPTREKA